MQVGAKKLAKALVFLAPGFEEIEACTIIDILRRCNVDVTVVGLVPQLVEGAHGIKVIPDKFINQVSGKDFDSIVCPGGAPGYLNLQKNQRVLQIVKEAFASGKLVAAICAAPAVLATAGILNGKECTIYPGMESELIRGGGKPKNLLVVEDGNIITSQGPATALPFTLKLAERLVDKKIAREVKKNTLTDLALK